MKIDELKNLYINKLKDFGMSNVESKIVAQALLYGDIKGYPQHGIMLLKSYINSINDKKHDPLLEKKTPSSILINGGDCAGPVVAEFATNALINLLKMGSGIAIVGVHNKSPFTIAGIYTEKIAKKNYIGILMCNSRARIAAPGSYEPVVGPNPFSIAFPTKEYPIIIDFANSAVTVGDIRKALREGRQLPKGVAYNSKGYETQIPEEALNGAITSMGGYKGFALAMAIELLAGPLVKGKAGKNVKGTRGYLLIGINPEIFTSIEEFKEKTQIFIDEIRKSSPIPGSFGTYIPGTKIQSKREEAEIEGIEIDDSILTEINSMVRAN